MDAHTEKQQALRNKLAVIRDSLLSLNAEAAPWANDDDLNAVYKAYEDLHKAVQAIPYHGLTFNADGKLTVI